MQLFNIEGNEDDYVYLPRSMQNVYFLPPKDMFFDDPNNLNNTPDGEGNNITINRGCGITIYAQYVNEYIEIVTFNNETDDPQEDEHYTPVYNSAYFDNGTNLDSIQTKDNVRLYVIDDVLWFECSEGSTDKFAISAETDNGFRPGDDFILQFAVADYDKVGIDGSVTGEVPEGDFLAMYDKKMLWRANLYIDEGDDFFNETSIPVDWNDRCPWIEGNEWNTQNGNGGQVITPVNVTSHNDSTVTDSVCYSLAAQDSPFEYNDKMLNHQLPLLSFIYDSQGNVDDSNPDRWDETTAPGNLWDNYESNIIDNNGITYYPYRPGYSSHDSSNGDKNTPGKSSGVDCTGFIQRSKSYNGEFYSLPSIGMRYWDTFEDTDPNRRYLTVTDDNNVSESHHNMWRVTIAPEFGEPHSLEKLVPGDIVYWWHNGGYHVTMINKLEYDDETRNTDTVRINLIEAWDDYQNRVSVLITRELLEIDREWIIGRLK